MAGDATPFSVNWLVRRINREHLVAALAKHARGRLLDVGCGTRPYGAEMARHAGRCIGLEPRRERHAGIPPDVCGSALDLPFGDGSFDTVVAAQVLEHVPEPGRMMEEMARVLGPDGCLIVTAPHIWGIHEEPHDYFRFTGYGLRYLAGRAGLETLVVRPMAGYWVTAGARFCHYLQRFERPLTAPLVRVLYALAQTLALVLDRLDRAEGDAWNFLLVARRVPGRAPGNPRGRQAPGEETERC